MLSAICLLIPLLVFTYWVLAFCARCCGCCTPRPAQARDLKLKPFWAALLFFGAAAVGGAASVWASGPQLETTLVGLVVRPVCFCSFLSHPLTLFPFSELHSDDGAQHSEHSEQRAG